VVEGVMRSIDDAWHANSAAPTNSSCAAARSPAYPPVYIIFNDMRERRIRNSMPNIEVNCYLLILPVTHHY